jgi:CRP/FNR family cyclic AMP-dependent transcriptional regulator
LRSDSAKGPEMDTQTSGRLIATTLLRQAVGFRECEPEAIDGLVAAGHVRTLGKGELLVRRGSPFEYLGVVIEGSLESSVLHEEGRRHLVAYLNPGDIAGIMSIWDGLPHPMDMLARTQPTQLLLIPRAGYLRVRDQYSSIARALELQMAYRVRLLYERTLVDAAMPLDVRLARVLHLLSIVSGQKLDDGEHLSMKMSQADIGDFLGVSRQRANFAVQQLKKDGLILLTYSVVTIIDSASLAKRAGM